MLKSVVIRRPHQRLFGGTAARGNRVPNCAHRGAQISRRASVLLVLREAG
jgi:hypothetical protein